MSRKGIHGLILLVGLLAISPAAASTVTFREGDGGYAGTRDTYLEENTPTTSYDAALALRWDADNPNGTNRRDYALLRFEEIVGTQPGRIPPGASVTLAVLSYTVTNTGNPAMVHEAALPWAGTATFASFCGAQCGPAQVGPLVASASGATAAEQMVDVTSSVQAWVAGATNHGWIFVPSGGDGVQFLSSETGTVAQRPRLTVTLDEPPPVTVLREPYLQLGTPASMTIAWRTNFATSSRVRFGLTQGVLDQMSDVAAITTDHAVTLSGLAPATRYYYDVGSTAGPQAGGSAEHFFETSPAPGSATPFRVWVVGDSGLGNVPQAQVRDAMLAATGADLPDLFLHMGDIAYTTGTEEQFTSYHFTPYRDILRHTVLWPTLGNHEGQSTVSGAPGPSIGPYYQAFVLPAGGEAGGLPSGTEAYYAFDYANVHFVCLNSYQVDRSATGAMATWLEADLEANTLPWVIAFWHHPPYTHGTHNSDQEAEHIEMRENLLPILEAAGVDLVLGGHSHTYERSLLIDGTYETPTPSLPTLVALGHVIDEGDGRPSGGGAYRKDPGVNPHDGTVYVVAGHGGAPLGGALDHPVMFLSEAAYGSVLLDVNNDLLTLTNLRSTGVVSDTFTLVKTVDVGPPTVASEHPANGSDVFGLAAITVSFNQPVTGVAPEDLVVNGSAATALTGASGGPGPYRFSGFAAPPSGPVLVTLLPGAIRDRLSHPFGGGAWGYVLHPGPVINEFLASNASVVADEFGDFDDYIEIHNRASIPIDLGGMHLTDDLSLRSQFTIPAGTVISPLGHALFWADGEPSEGPVHTNFALVASGEQIGLYDADLEPLDTVTYGAQTTDIPSGRFPDGAPAFVAMPPTPGSVNTIACASDAECAPLGHGCSAGICAEGRCETGQAPDGAQCDDGSECTLSDACSGGVCTGAIPVPADVTGLRWPADAVTLVWDPTAGPEGTYDLARGGPGELPIGEGSPVCLAEDLSSTSASDGAVPRAGGFFWYLVRGATVCSPGTWGYGFDGSSPKARHLQACP